MKGLCKPKYCPTFSWFYLLYHDGTGIEYCPLLSDALTHTFLPQYAYAKEYPKYNCLSLTPMPGHTPPLGPCHLSTSTPLPFQWPAAAKGLTATPAYLKGVSVRAGKEATSSWVLPMKWVPGKGSIGQVQEEKPKQKKEHQNTEGRGQHFKNCGFNGSGLSTGTSQSWTWRKLYGIWLTFQNQPCWLASNSLTRVILNGILTFHSPYRLQNILTYIFSLDLHNTSVRKVPSPSS